MENNCGRLTSQKRFNIFCVSFDVLRTLNMILLGADEVVVQRYDAVFREQKFNERRTDKSGTTCHNNCFFVTCHTFNNLHDMETISNALAGVLGRPRAVSLPRSQREALWYRGYNDRGFFGCHSTKTTLNRRFLQRCPTLVFWRVAKPQLRHPQQSQDQPHQTTTDMPRLNPEQLRLPPQFATNLPRFPLHHTRHPRVQIWARRPHLPDSLRYQKTERPRARHEKKRDLRKQARPAYLALRGWHLQSRFPR